jgi:hypothetical protein
MKTTLHLGGQTVYKQIKSKCFPSLCLNTTITPSQNDAELNRLLTIILSNNNEASRCFNIFILQRGIKTFILMA